MPSIMTYTEPPASSDIPSGDIICVGSSSGEPYYVFLTLVAILDPL